MSKANYNCSQSELYAGAELLAASLLENIADFTAFQARFDAGFVANFDATIAGARAIPDLPARLEQQEMKRLDLVALLEGDVYNVLGSLRIFIKKAYTNPAQQKVQLSAAGFDDYEKAMKENWDLLKNLLTTASAYVASHQTALSANGNMDAGFPVTIEALKNLMISEITVYSNYRDNAKEGTSDKIDANNKVYAIVVDVCEVGQFIYARNPAKQSQFVWDSILDIISSPGSAGLKVFVRDGVTFLARANAEIKIQRPGEPVITLVTDANGFVHFTNLPVGTYVGNITGAGYPEFNFEVTIETGVTSTKRFDTMPL
jgi:hypothetical protein